MTHTIRSKLYFSRDYFPAFYTPSTGLLEALHVPTGHTVLRSEVLCMELEAHDVDGSYVAGRDGDHA